MAQPNPALDRVKGLKNTSLKISNYKCFGPDFEGFERIMPMNIIIGRNSSGKSALIDIVEAMISGEIPAGSDVRPETVIQGSEVLNAQDIRNGFNVNDPNRSFNEYIRQQLRDIAVNKSIDWFQKRGHPRKFLKLGFGEGDVSTTFGPGIFERKDFAINKLRFAKIGAERDVRPEKKAETELKIRPNGDNATNIVERVLHNTSHSRELIRTVLLRELNVILAPDSHYQELDCRYDTANDEWEIFVFEEHKGGVPLSKTGSGVKTILLVLLHLYVLPSIARHTELGEFVFAFEELENNLHPALQRRLFAYLLKFATDHRCTFFIATHSPVVIDQFATEPDAQIVHVTHDGKVASVSKAQSYQNHVNILADLEVKASDLLQSNCIVWVEGPSDRIYFNRWIQLAYDGAISEGVHYTCLSYGGSLLAGLSADTPENVADELISMLKINMHAVVIMDRDNKKASDELGRSKQRIIEQLERCGGRHWVTSRREVEHCIPAHVLQAHYETHKTLNQFQSIEQFHFAVTKKKRVDKVKLALAVSGKLSLTDMLGMDDWPARISEIGTYIAEKNRLRPIPAFVGYLA